MVLVLEQVMGNLAGHSENADYNSQILLFKQPQELTEAPIDGSA
jgi:hypothetical protein